MQYIIIFLIIAAVAGYLYSESVEMEKKWSASIHMSKELEEEMDLESDWEEWRKVKKEHE